MNDADPIVLGPTPLCVRYRPTLALLHTDALTRRELADVNEHLASCSWCRRELAAYDALDAGARQHLAGVALTPLTLEDIAHAAETPTLPDADAAPTSGAGQTRTIRPPVRHRPPLAALGPLAAVAVLVLLAGLIFAARSSGPSLGGPSSGTPAPTSPVPTPPTQSADLAQTSWTLARLVVDGREQPLVPGRVPTLRFGPHDGQFTGRGGCNGYGGTYTRAGDALHVSGIYHTDMYCQSAAPQPTALMEQEAAYFRALPRVARDRRDGNTLTLTSADKSVQLTFDAN